MKIFYVFLLMIVSASSFASADMIDLIEEDVSILTITRNLSSFKKFASHSRNSFGVSHNGNDNFFAVFKDGQYCKLAELLETGEQPKKIAAGTKFVFSSSVKDDHAGTVALHFIEKSTIKHLMFTQRHIRITCFGNYLNYAGTFTTEVENDLGDVVRIDIKP